MYRHLLLHLLFITSWITLRADMDQIKHVVVVMLENRSFDNVLAWLYSQDDAPKLFIPEGSDPTYYGLTPDILENYSNSLYDSSGNLVYSCPPIQGTPSTLGTPYLNSPMFDPRETFPYVTQQIYGNDPSKATMTGFLQDYASFWEEEDWQNEKQNISAIMETYTADQLPVFYGLAKHYAVSDLWFSSVPTQTNPNRAFAACGTSDGQLYNGPFSKSTFTSDTIWNRLTDLRPESSWMIFWQANMMPGFVAGPFTGTNCFPAMKRIPNLQSHYALVDRFHELARNGYLPDFSFLEPQLTTVFDLSTQIKSIFHCDEWPLNKLQVLFGVQGNDFHPPGDSRTTENFLANIYTSLIANQEAWNQTLLVITFDEHGGLFDHVPPPSAIPPDNRFQNGFLFDRYGVRVPTIFVSPLINQATIVRSSDPQIPFDHTSILSTILQWKNIDPKLWKMGKRTQAAPTFDSVLTLQTPRTDTVIGAPTLPPQGIPIQMGDTFYLHDSAGNYIATGFCESGHAFTGASDRKATLAFVNGTGAITHGSFVLLSSLDPERGASNLLSSSVFEHDCYFDELASNSTQWWTIKSRDFPYLGAPICYGDRIYLENHVYMDLIEFVPCRLTKKWGLCLLTTKPVSDDDSNDLYWIIDSN